VYTVTVIFGTAPLRSNRQLVEWCFPLSFSGPETLKIPAVRSRGPRGRRADTGGFLDSGWPVEASKLWWSVGARNTTPGVRHCEEIQDVL